MPLNETKKVSIYIPCYNDGEFILRALSSIPVRDDIEVILVDDGSTDNSLQIMREFKSQSKLKVRIIACDENQGISYANNIGIDSCKGEYFYLIDADDYLYTEEFEKAIEELDGTDIIYVNAISNENYVMKPSEKNHNLCAGWFKFIRTEFINGIRRKINCYGGDYDMWLELITKPHTCKHTDLLVYHYNYPREGSVTWKREHPTPTISQD